MNKIKIIPLLLLIIMVLTSCVGQNDWSYQLKNGYEISHINSAEIVCAKKDAENTVQEVIGGYVTKFTYDNECVYLQYLDKYDEDFKNFSAEKFKYATVNFITDEIAYFESHTEFIAAVSDDNLTDLDKWIATKSAPKGAEFPN